MGRAFSPRSVCDAILGRCPRLVWGAPLALRHTRFTRFMHARHPRHAWRGRRGRRGRASTPRRFSTRCLTWRRMISMRASCMRDGAWTTRSSRHEQGQRPASIPAWGSAPRRVMKKERGLKARSMCGCATGWRGLSALCIFKVSDPRRCLGLVWRRVVGPLRIVHQKSARHALDGAARYGVVTRMFRNHVGSPCSVSMSFPWPGAKPSLFLNLLFATQAFQSSDFVSAEEHSFPFR